jgi:hypothetical protein
MALSKAEIRFDEYGPQGLNNTDLRGIQAHSFDKDWSSLPCPPIFGQDAGVQMQFIVVGGNTQNTMLVQYLKHKVPDGAGGCVVEYEHDWAWSSNFSSYCTSLGLSTPCLGEDSFSLQYGQWHTYSVYRSPSGCASGVSYCWHFDNENGTFHTCCGDTISEADYAEVYLNCYNQHDQAGSNCGSSGEVNGIDNLQIKDTGDGWVNWAGKDQACVDYGQQARGKWNSATSLDVAYNINIGGSIQGCQ